MIEQRHRYDERYEAAAVPVYCFEELLLLHAVEMFLEVSHDVVEDIGVLGGCSHEAQGVHQGPAISLPHFGVIFPDIRGHFSECGEVFRAVRHDEVLVPCMKFDEACGRASAPGKLLPSVVDENTFDEVFPEPGVVEPALVLDRYEGEPLHESGGEKARPV